METIRQGSKGAQVTRWQFFLIGQGAQMLADGDFGSKTHNETVAFQKKHRLVADGIVGKNTYLAAFKLGLRLQEALDFPGKPNFRPLSGNNARAAVFGKFKFRSKRDGTEAIEILGDWEQKNIVAVEIPQLVGVPGMLPSGKVRFHRLGAKQLQQLFKDWENAGLIPLILTYAGSYVPRFIRGSRTTLSNHAFGSAFDINVAWNGLGQVPALLGEKGCVRELVEIAHKNGFYWGGHFKRQDGMHFEVAVLK
jgi:hypothetical protein